MPTPRKLPDLENVHLGVSTWMWRWGHRVHRICLAIVFLWFGALKIFGQKSASSLIAHTVFFVDPELMVPILGLWEISIGALLLFRRYLRVALALLAIRLPGTLMALILKADICFIEFPWVPSLEGQYLVKDFLLLGAAMVIGGTLRAKEPDPGVYH